MIDLFDRNKTLILIALPILVVIYVTLNNYLVYFEAVHEIKLGLFGSIIMPNILLQQFISCLLIFLNGITINYTFNKHAFFTKSTLFPAYFYVIWMSFFEEMYNPNGIILSHTFLILALTQFFNLDQNIDGRKSVFNASLFLGLASCFQPTFLIFFPFLFVLVFSVRPYVFHEIILVIIGFITPFIYVLFYDVYTHSNLLFNIGGIENEFLDPKNNNLFVITLFILTGILCFFGLISKMKNSSIQLRKLIKILNITFVCLCIIGFINLFYIKNQEAFSFLLIILTFFSVYSISQKGTTILATLFYILVFISSFLKFLL